MGLRIPLPRQVEKVHKDKTIYDRKTLDKVYSDDKNQPTAKYMKGLKKIQAKAIKNDLRDRLIVAIGTDPVRALARDLILEGYTEADVIKELRDLVPDVARVRLQNCMRDELNL